MKHVFLLVLLTFHSLSSAQKITVIKPANVTELDFPEAYIRNFNTKESWANCDKVLQKLEDENYQMTAAEEKIMELCDETKESPWDIIGSSCSWYCMGGGDSVTASSQLVSQGKNSYAPGNAHDLNYETAWAEGAKGNGEREFLEYHFDSQSNPITDIMVVNGYVKSQQAWENNARVKKLKVYVDGKPLAILELQDKRAEQSFPLGKLKIVSRKTMTIKFEILEVYPGKKYQDAVITDIYFDGPSH